MIDGPDKHLRPDVLRKLARMELRAREIVDGLLTGMHRSRARGFNSEFLEHREYVPGDDPRRIDWKLYARSERLCLKQYGEDTALRCFILLDSSASMKYTGDPARETKWDYAAVLAVSAAYLFLKQGDSVGFLTFGAAPKTVVEPRGVREQLYRILTALTEPPEGETDIASTLRRLSPQLGKGAFVVIVSDLLAPPDEVTAAIKALRVAGHDIAVFHVLDPDEIDFPYSRSARFIDLETGRAVTADPLALKRAYKRNVEKFIAGHEEFCRRNGVDFAAAVTSEPVEKALLKFLMGRRSRTLRKSF